LKLILEVYETFTYPSREGQACGVARSCDTQAVSLLYLQTTYVFNIDILYLNKI